MSLFEMAAGQILESLGSDQRLADIEIVEGFSPKQRITPLDRSYAAIGLGPVKLAPSALDGYLGTEGGADQYGRQAELTLQIQICVPASMGGKSCIDVFSRLADSLLFCENGLCLQSISCGKPEYASRMGAFVLEGEIGVTGWLRQTGQKDGG